MFLLLTDKIEQNMYGMFETEAVVVTGCDELSEL